MNSTVGAKLVCDMLNPPVVLEVLRNVMYLSALHCISVMMRYQWAQPKSVSVEVSYPPGSVKSFNAD